MTNPPTARSSVALAAAAVLLVACQAAPVSPSPATSAGLPSASPPPVTVVVEDGRFVPPGGSPDGVPALTVPTGTTVTFRNEGGLRHTATHSENGFPLPEPLFDLNLEPGTEGSHTFGLPGVFQVTCVPHPEMVLTITVE